jgi:hypothetical protein
LDNLTLEGRTEPSREIFAGSCNGSRSEWPMWPSSWLRKFTFTGEDRYQLDRREAPFPKDEAEARALWRQHLRYEILQELLNLKPND